MNKTTVTRPFQDVTTELQINLGFWETDHPPLPLVNIITYFPLWANSWLKGGVGGQFPRNLIDPT